MLVLVLVLDLANAGDGRAAHGQVSHPVPVVVQPLGEAVHPVLHSTSPLQAPPVHSTLQRQALLQRMALWHAPPEHVTEQGSPAAQMSSPVQVVAPLQLIVQAPPLHDSLFVQASFEHSIAQLSRAAHVTASVHALAPLHLSLHLVAPAGQAHFAPSHVTSQTSFAHFMLAPVHTDAQGSGPSGLRRSALRGASRRPSAARGWSAPPRSLFISEGSKLVVQASRP